MNIDKCIDAYAAMDSAAQDRVISHVAEHGHKYPLGSGNLLECAIMAELKGPVDNYAAILAERSMPPAARGAVEIIRAKGHLVNVRKQRTGSLRYRVDSGREMTCLQMTRKYREYGL